MIAFEYALHIPNQTREGLEVTPEQESQFNLFGCGPLCLMRLAEIRGTPISKDALSDRFAPRFAMWSTHCGIAPTSILFEIARDLGLCSTLSTRVNPEPVRKLFNGTGVCGIIVSTDRAKNRDGSLHEIYHYRLLLKWDAITLTLWHPDQSGVGIEMPISISQLREEMPHFLILQ